MKNDIIRVLHVVGGMNQGGTENFLMNLYRNIDREKVQFDFLVNREGFFDEEIKKMGGRIYYIPALQKVGQIRYTKNLDDFFQQHKEYKIVHSHINQVSGLILERANKANIPVRIAHSHGSKSPRNIVKYIYKEYLGRKILNNATILIGCSDKASEWLYKKQKDKSIIINNGIEVDRFKFDIEKRNKIRKELKISKNNIVIGHVGRFVQPKNHKFLIEVFKEYSVKNENSKLLLVGEGRLKSKIKKMIDNYNLKEKVIMMDNRNDINDIYQAMDLFIFPSINEGLPLVVIEAQIAGLNVLCSSNISTMVDVTGNVKFLDIKETSKKMWVEEMLKINKDKERKDESEKVKRKGYDIKDVAKELEKIYINEEQTTI